MATTPLHSLLSEQGALFRAYHEGEPVVLRKAVSLAGLPTTADVDLLIDASLLRWPYFTVLQDGVTLPRSEVTATRTVAGTDVAGFVRPDGVRKYLADGATLKLSQVEDWHRFVRAQADELRAVFPAEITSFLFCTPASRHGTMPHRDGARAIVIQIDGAKEWHLYHAPGVENPDPGLDVDPESEVDCIVLEPGDVLYLPPAHGHAASACGTRSLHLRFTIAEPTPTALLESFVREWIGSTEMAELVEQQYGMAVADRAAAVLVELEKFTQRVDTDAVLANTLASAMLRDKS